MDMWRVDRFIISSYTMKLTFVAFLSLIALSSAIYTSSYWTKRGFKVNSSEPLSNPYLGVNAEPQLRTVCNDVDLNIPPYNYSSVVMSGYLSVNKSNSGLGFIFYGK